MSLYAWCAAVIAGLVALLAPFGIRPLLVRFNTFDVPNQRSSHAKPTLRGGGIAALLGLVVGGLVAMMSLPGGSAPLAVVVAAAVSMSLVGLADDLRGLTVPIRASLQLVVGTAVAVAVCSLFDMSWISIPVAAVGFAANVNFTNFMDGINGISSLHGLVTGIAYASLGTLAELQWLTVVGLILAVVFFAFLPWNLTPPGMFLGDVGSYLLGGALGATAIAAVMAGLSPLAALAPLSIYWADALATLITRVRKGEPAFEAHRSHVYQRLARAPFSHMGSATMVAVFTLAVSLVGIMVATSRLQWLLGVVLIAMLILGYLNLPRLRGDRPLRSASYALSPAPPPLAAWPARSDWHPRRWAVLGASGFIGDAMVKHLSARGATVLPLSAPRVDLDPRTADGEQIAALAQACLETDKLAEALKGVDVVINAAGLAAPDSAPTAALYGANSRLPAIIAAAAIHAKAGRFIQLSSAAVQGNRPVLDDSTEVAPFSPYSNSKALGERAILAMAGESASETELVIVRATSVQGRGRPTTESLRRIARSPLASVAAPGNYPTVVSSVSGLVDFVYRVGCSSLSLAPIQLQPWEGANVREVLEFAGARDPLILPVWLCRGILATGKIMGKIAPRFGASVRRLEIMWFGQSQQDHHSIADGRDRIRCALAEDQQNCAG